MNQEMNITAMQNNALKDVNSERRHALQVVTYWNHLRGSRAMPIENEIDMEDPAIKDLWPRCFIVQLRDIELEIPEFNYTYLGPEIVHAYEGELQGVEVDDMVSMNASKLMGAYKQVIETVQPVLHSGECDNGRGSLIKFRQCLLPLGTDKVEVILGYLNYYVFAKP